MTETSQSWTWTFRAAPDAVWAVMADTVRFNEAAELPRHRIVEVPQADGGVLYRGEAKIGPFELAWRDHPVDWVSVRAFTHRRTFERGPLASMTASFEIEPDPRTGGSIGRYTLAAEPRGLLGRLVLAAGFFSKTERRFARLAAEADAHALGQQEEKFRVPPPALGGDALGRIAASARRMTEHGVPQALAQRLGAFAARAPESDLAHVRPIGLARRWGEGERQVIEACLAAVRAGLLELQWDLLCPNCRGAKSSAPSLDRVPSGAHCGTCNIDYGRDFARNVELTFRPARSA